MVGKQGAHRKEIADKNKMLILKTLGDRDLSFEEIINVSGFSRGTVASWLKKLRKSNHIEKVIDSDTDRPVYRTITQELLRDIIVPEFVSFIGSKVVVQILQKEMGLLEEINMGEAFGFGTIELFVDENYKNKEISYEEILEILKEEYGDWIVKEGVDDKF